MLTVRFNGATENVGRLVAADVRRLKFLRKAALLTRRLSLLTSAATNSQTCSMGDMFVSDWARKLHADDSLTPGLRKAQRFAGFEMADFRSQIGGCRSVRRKTPNTLRQRVATDWLPSRLWTFARCRI